MAPFTGDRKRRRPASDDAAGAPKRDSVKKARVDDQRSSIFVRSLPPSATTESLAEFFSEYFPVKHAVVVADQKTKESRGFGFVTFADASDAKGAQEALDKKDWDGRRIRVDIAEPRHRNAGPGETAPTKTKGKVAYQPPPTKLIVRNLPWSIKTSDQLARLFISFGKVKFADLPQDKGKLKGFGFVTIRGRPNAEKALEMINGRVVDGRTLAVDWAVDKGTWDQQQAKEEVKPGKKSKSEKRDDKNDEGDDEDDENKQGAQDRKDSKNGKDKDGSEVKNRDDQLDADLANFMKNYLHNMEDEEDDDENKDEDEEEEEDPEGLDSESEDDAEKDTKAALPIRQKTTDNSATVFVRNVPFTTTDEQLKSFFSHFGNIRYARVVMDKITEKPAGTGFVCFFDKDDAKTCIVGAPRRAQPTSGVKNSILQDENADPTGKYTMDGRVLQVVQAVGKEEAGNLTENSLASRREKDKRKLFLLAEGNVSSNSPLYGLLTENEIRMRQTSAAQRKKLVQKNPMLHISLTRLALRNIPRNMGAKELKELARKAVVGFAEDVRAGRRQPLSKEENARDAKDAKEKERERKLKKKGIVRQAKIVFEDNKGSKVSETSGAGKSRGYGFIEFASHRWALMGLRYLNGHQVESGDGSKKQRLIAEFAIENTQVVQRRRAAQEKASQAVKARGGKDGAGADANTDAENEEEDHEHEDDEAADEGNKKENSHGKGGKEVKKSTYKKGNKVKGRAPLPKKEAGDAEAEGQSSKPETAKEAMQHKLIARKRLMKKKKVAAPGKK